MPKNTVLYCAFIPYSLLLGHGSKKCAVATQEFKSRKDLRSIAAGGDVDVDGPDPLLLQPSDVVLFGDVWGSIRSVHLFISMFLGFQACYA